MADALLIIVTIVMTVLCLGFSFYLLVVYMHPDDKGWGTAIYCKILVVVGMTFCWAQALLLPLDVANNHYYHNSGGIDMQILWFIVYIATLVLITILLPFAIFFYQTDEDDSFLKRFFTAAMFLVITLIVTIIVLFVSWAFFKYADLPVDMVTAEYASAGSSSDSSNITVSDYKGISTTLTITSSLVVYIMAIMAFFGWILLIIFGGVGMFALPIDMINAFRHRPKPRRSGQMTQIKNALARNVGGLIKDCAELQEEEKQIANNSEEGWYSKYKNKKAFENKMNEFRAKYTSLEEQYEVFQLQLTYENTNPIIPFLKLILGIIFFITAFLWLLQLIFGYLARKLNRPLIPLFNELLIYMENNNAGFVATFIYGYLILYLMWCVIKGNIKFGVRIPFVFKFHPMKENATWMNSFLFNVILILPASVAITHLAASCFPTYSRNTEIYNMFGLQVNYMRFYTYIFTKQIFPIAFVIVIFLSLIYSLFTCNKPPKHIEEIEEIKKKFAQKSD